MTSSSIDFGQDRTWGGVSQQEYQRMARDPRHPFAYRIHFAALGWADRHGHASFGPGKLVGGRPSVVDDDTLAVARARHAKGDSVTAIAKALGIGRATLYRHLGEST